MENDDSSAPDRGAPLSDTIKKILTTGLSAAFMTEESIRGFVSDLKLPKETMHLLLQGASKSKEELMNRVGNEIVKVISKIDLVKEASRFVEEHKFKISAEVEVLKRDSSTKDSAKESSKDVSKT